jgi:hypothetical protein
LAVAEAADKNKPMSANRPAIARPLGAVHRNMVELLLKKAVKERP